MPALSPKPQSHPNPNLESNPYPKPPPPRLFEQAEIDRWNAMFAAEAAALQQAGPGGPGGGGRGGGGGGPPGARVRVSHCPGCGQATVGGGGARVSGRWALSVTTAPPVWTPTPRAPPNPTPTPSFRRAATTSSAAGPAPSTSVQRAGSSCAAAWGSTSSAPRPAGSTRETTLRRIARGILPAACGQAQGWVRATPLQAAHTLPSPCKGLAAGVALGAPRECRSVGRGPGRSCAAGHDAKRGPRARLRAAAAAAGLKPRPARLRWPDKRAS
jgi:hypothetical protein